VEGCGHDSQRELARFTGISIASSSELEYWLLTARDEGYIANAEYERLLAMAIEVRRMLFGFRAAVRL